MQMDWVKRKAIGEQFMKEQKEKIWKDLCASLESATNSYSVHYGGAAHGHFESDHHFRITVKANPPYQAAVVDVTFAAPEIHVVFTRGHCKTSTFVLNPSREAPFRRDKCELTTEEVSEAILRCAFFPAEGRGTSMPIVTPCSAEMLT